MVPGPRYLHQTIRNALRSFSSACLTRSRWNRSAAQELGQRLGLDSADLLAELGTLEVLGQICRESGNRFRRTLQAVNQRRS